MEDMEAYRSDPKAVRHQKAGVQESSVLVHYWYLFRQPLRQAAAF